ETNYPPGVRTCCTRFDSLVVSLHTCAKRCTWATSVLCYWSAPCFDCSPRGRKNKQSPMQGLKSSFRHTQPHSCQRGARFRARGVEVAASPPPSPRRIRG